MCIGVILTIFRTGENCPIKKNMLKESLNCWEISFLRCFTIFIGSWSFLELRRTYFYLCFIRKVICLIFERKFDIWFCILSYKSEAVIENITHSSRICNGFPVKLNWVRNCSSDIFHKNYSFRFLSKYFGCYSSYLQNIFYYKSVYFPSLM